MMKTIKIEIPAMQSTHCQMRVRNGIQGLNDITILKIYPGVAELQVSNELNELILISNIQNAGYDVAGIRAMNDNTSEEIFRFKTNINCSGCVEKVSPALNNAEGICHWDVKTGDPDKILEVHSNGITREEVIRKVQDSGFKIVNK
jgi:copper chaperone